MARKKTWREKLMDGKDLPKVVFLRKDARKPLGRQTCKRLLAVDFQRYPGPRHECGRGIFQKLLDGRVHRLPAADPKDLFEVEEISAMPQTPESAAIYREFFNCGQQMLQERAVAYPGEQYRIPCSQLLKRPDTCRSLPWSNTDQDPSVTLVAGCMRRQIGHPFQGNSRKDSEVAKHRTKFTVAPRTSDLTKMDPSAIM
jgi:hypothetical protein